MDKIKDKVKNYFLQFKHYGFTFGVIYLLTILFAFTVDSDFLEDTVFGSFMMSLGFLSIFFLIVESKYKKEKKTKYLLLSLIPSVLIGIISYVGSNIIKTSTFELYFDLCLLFIIIISGLYFIYNVFKNGKLSFDKFIKNVLFNIIEVAIIYLTLVIGTSLLLLLFSFLIYEVSDAFVRMEILLCGLYFVPSLILSVKTEDNKSEFLSSLFTKVLFILMLIAFVIIYVYIFKLLFTNTLLENSIFYILSFLFVFSLPVWIINGVIKTKINKINKFVPYAFIPFIILQIIAIIIRINDYGITELRYLGVMLVLFEIIYMLFYIFKIKLEKIMFAVAAISFITFICPFLNVVSVSNNSQLNRLLDIYEKKDHSENDLKAMATIFDRFSHDGYSREYLMKKVDTDVVADLDEIYDKYRYPYSFYETERNKYQYYSWYNDERLTTFDVSGFKKVEIINSNQIISSTENYNHKEVVDKEKVNIGNYKIDLSNVFKNMIKDRNYLDDNYIVNVDFNTRLIITQLSFSYYEKYDQVSNLNIKGYLLTK